jgi:hypothetical protein
METMSQSTRVALDAALERNAQKAGQQVDWQRTRIASPRGGILGSDPFRQAADTVLRNRAHDTLDRAMDAEEQELSRRVKRNSQRHRALNRHAPKKRQSIAFDAAQTLLAKDARAFLSDLAIGVDTNKKSLRPWFSVLRSHVEQLPTDATVSDMDTRILRGCIRELL